MDQSGTVTGSHCCLMHLKDSVKSQGKGKTKLNKTRRTEHLGYAASTAIVTLEAAIFKSSLVISLKHMNVRRMLRTANVP